MNGPAIEPTVTKVLRDALDLAAIAGEIVEEMPQGASTRRFFRIGTPDGGSLVAMYAPEAMGGPAAAKQARGHARFLEARALLEAWGLPVPSLHGSVPELDVIFVEDLGPETLAAHLLCQPERASDLYTKAVTLLAQAQARFAEFGEGTVVQERAFDYELLRFEVDHFLDFGLLASGVDLSLPERGVFEAAADYLAKTIAELARGFVHRDYQSRNLMVRPAARSPELTWIDFQDVMLGPRAYDLVALLMDSYQNFDEAFVQARLEEYCQMCAIDYEPLRSEFDLITVQRKLKDAGRFVYLHQVRNNPAFLEYVDASIARASSALDRIRTQAPPLDRLAELLRQVVPRRFSSSPPPPL